ncbi:hypothetical protein T01_3279, partial [Trichinella spiralis]
MTIAETQINAIGWSITITILQIILKSLQLHIKNNSD